MEVVKIDAPCLDSNLDLTPMFEFNMWFGVFSRMDILKNVY